MVSAVISLKEPGRAPGDASSDTMDFVADLAERYSRNEARVNYTQNLCKSQIRSFDRLEAIAIQYFSPTERNTHGPGLAITR